MTDVRANYAIFQAHLFHENDNLNQRLFWYLFSQSLLFAAYSGTLNLPEKARSTIIAGQQEALIWVVPIMALLISCALYPMIIISVRHMHGLRRQFTAQAGSKIDDLPPIHGDPMLRNIGDVSYLTIPVVLTGAWLFLLIRFSSRATGA